MTHSQIYMLDTGILLAEYHPEYDSHSKVYDRLNGYCTEKQCYAVDINDAIERAKKYVTDSIDRTYAVVSKTNGFDTDVNIEEMPVENEGYFLSDVVYSIAKIDGKIVENFVKKTKRLHITMSYTYVGDTGIDIPMDMLAGKSEEEQLEIAFEYAQNNMYDIPLARNAEYITDSDSFDLDDIDFDDEEIPVENESHFLSDVVYSIMMKNKEE